MTDETLLAFPIFELSFTLGANEDGEELSGERHG
jgi:hypothetical protein